MRYRGELNVEEAPAPQRLAPFAVALTAEILDPDPNQGEDLASGRFVLLHDPDGVDAWAGTFRVVSFVRAILEPDLAGDPLLGSVGWSWLVESLVTCGAPHTAIGGTVTRVNSESFGALQSDVGGEGIRGQIEIRASWTPVGDPDELSQHALAWSSVMSTAAGLLPAPVSLT